MLKPFLLRNRSQKFNFRSEFTKLIFYMLFKGIH